jgi:hypothetical protein
VRDRDEFKHRRGKDGREAAAEPGKVTLAGRADAPIAESAASRGQRHEVHTTKSGTLYDDRGRAAAEVAAHRAVNVHDGSIRMLEIDAARVECVYVDHGDRAGWMQTSCLPAVVAREQRSYAVSPAAARGTSVRRHALVRDVDGVPPKRRKLIAATRDGEPDLDADGWSLDEVDEFVVDEPYLELDDLVFGYVELDGERIYGWIDKSLLGDPL